MTDNVSAVEVSRVPHAESKIFSRVLMVLVLGILLVGLFLLAWLLAQKVESYQQRQEQRLATVETLVQSSHAQTQLAEQQTIKMLEQHALLVAQDQNLREQVQQLQAQIAALSTNHTQRVLSEVDQLIAHALLLLQTSGNSDYVVGIIKLALKRVDPLTGTSAVTFRPLHQALQADLAVLQRQSGGDLSQRLIEMDMLLSVIEKMPFQYAAPVIVSSISPLSYQLDPVDKPVIHFLNNAYERLLRLVRIEKTGGDLPLVLSKDQEFFARETLRLHLLAARTALLTRNWLVFERELKAEQLLIGRYFSNKDSLLPEAKRLLSQALASADFFNQDSSQLLTATLKALATLKQSQGQTP